MCIWLVAGSVEFICNNGNMVMQGSAIFNLVISY